MGDHFRVVVAIEARETDLSYPAVGLYLFNRSTVSGVVQRQCKAAVIIIPKVSQASPYSQVISGPFHSPPLCRGYWINACATAELRLSKCYLTGALVLFWTRNTTCTTVSQWWSLLLQKLKKFLKSKGKQSTKCRPAFLRADMLRFTCAHHEQLM